MTVKRYGPDTNFGYVCTVTLTLEIWPRVKWKTMYYLDPTWQWGVMARRQILAMCALWPWSWKYDLGLRSWHTLWSLTTIMWNIIQTQHGSDELWPGHEFIVCMHCDLDIGVITLGQGHDIPLGHGQQFYEILSRSNMDVRSYGPDTDCWYVWTVTLTLDVWPWVNVMTDPCVQDNNCVEYYTNRTRGKKLWTDINRRTDRPTDEHTDRMTSIYPQTFRES